jgi:hypothetical protein
VESGLADSDEDFKVALKDSPRSIGGDGFRAWIDKLYQQRVETHARPEDVSFRHISEPLPADEVLRILAAVLDVDIDVFKRRRHGCPLRAIAARYLTRYAGQSQRDVADYLNVGSGSAVGQQLKCLPDKLAKDRSLRRQIKEIEERLENARCARASP